MSLETVAFGSLYLENSRNGVYKKKEFQGRGTSIIKMTEMFDSRILYPENHNLEKVELTSTEKDRFLLESLDLIFARTSVVAEGVGKCTVVPGVKGEVAFESNLIRVRLDRERANPKFYNYFFQSPEGRGKILAIANGAAIRTIRGSDLIDVAVPAPKLNIQDHVAAILSAYDDLIENNRRRIALLEQAARLLYREWFVHFRFPGHETANIVDGLPERWEPATLGDHVELRKEAVKPDQFRSDDIHIGLEHIPRRSSVLANWESVEGLASHKFRFEADDIIFGKIRPYFHKVGFALRGGVTSSDAFVWRVKEARLWPLVMTATSSDYFVAVASKTVREGAKMPRADWKVLVDFAIPTPPDALLLDFNTQISSNAKLCRKLALQNKQLTRARDLLLPRLMDGRIPV